MESFTIASKKPRDTYQTFEQVPSFTTGNSFNDETNFILFKNKGKLVDPFIEITMTIETDAAPVIYNPFGTTITKIIELTSSSGVIQRITDRMIEARLSEIKDTPLYNKIMERLLNALVPSTTQDYTVKFPLFLFFTDKKEDFFTTTTNNNENFKIRIVNNDSLNAMGLDTDVLSISNIRYKLKSHYIKTSVDLMQTEKVHKNGYNMFEDYNETISAGTTETKIYLKCDYKVFNLHLNISSGVSDVQINRVVIDGPDYHRDIKIDDNFSLSRNSNFDSSDPTSFFTVPFGSRYDNYDTDNYITFDPEKSIYTATIYCDAVPGGVSYRLYAISEYHTKIITENGMTRVQG